MREIGPFVPRDDLLDPDGGAGDAGYSLFWAVEGRGRKSVTLDLRKPEGQDLFRELAKQSDAVIENFSPRVMENFGLDWDAVHTCNPRAVMVRMPAFGLDGPWRDRTGFAQTMEQITGMAWVTGFADGAGDESLGRVEAVHDGHVTHPRTPSQPPQVRLRRPPGRPPTPDACPLRRCGRGA